MEASHEAKALRVKLACSRTLMRPSLVSRASSFRLFVLALVLALFSALLSALLSAMKTDRESVSMAFPCLDNGFYMNFCQPSS